MRYPVDSTVPRFLVTTQKSTHQHCLNISWDRLQLRSCCWWHRGIYEYKNESKGWCFV